MISGLQSVISPLQEINDNFYIIEIMSPNNYKVIGDTQLDLEVTIIDYFQGHCWETFAVSSVTWLTKQKLLLNFIISLPRLAFSEIRETYNSAPAANVTVFGRDNKSKWYKKHCVNISFLTRPAYFPKYLVASDEKYFA